MAPAGFESVTPWRPRKKTVVTRSVDVTRRAVRLYLRNNKGSGFCPLHHHSDWRSEPASALLRSPLGLEI